MELTDAEVADLYYRYAGILLHRCRSILGNDEDAHDAVQETFAKVIHHSESFRKQSSPLTWMYRISTNHCLNQVRNRGGRSRKLTDRHHEVPVPTELPVDESRPDRARVLELLDDTDDQTRQVVLYIYFDDCTRQETANLVGISVPTVRKRLDTFLRTARRALTGAAAVALLILWQGSL